MATELEIQTLLSGIERSLREPFSAWLMRDEMRLRRDTQIVRYLERTHRPDFRTHLLARLSPGARILLHYILAEEIPIAGPILTHAVAKGYQVTSAHIGELHSRGCVFFDAPSLWPGANAVWSQEHMDGVLVVPPALSEDLIPLDAPPACPVYTSAKASRVKNPDESAVPSAIRAFLTCVNKKTLKLTQRGEFTSRALQMWQKEYGKPLKNGIFSPHYIWEFAHSKSLVKMDSTGKIIPARRFATYRSKPLPEQAAEFLSYTFSHPFHDERSTQNKNCSIDLVPFCAVFLRYVLVQHSDDTWLSIPSIARHAHTALKNAFCPEKGRRRWYWPSSSLAFPSERTLRDAITSLIHSWLIPTAVVATAVDARGTACIRPTPLGLFWLRGDTQPTHDEAPQKLVVQPDFTAVLTHSGPWDPVAQVLGLFAERNGDHNACVFTFTRESIRTAIQHGHAIDELFHTLDTHCSYSIPDNVRHTLYDWCHFSSHITLHRDVHLFSFSTKKERDDFLSHHPKGLFPTAVGSHFALVDGPENTVLDAMQILHALPVDYGEPPNDGLDIKQDGRVECNAPHDLRVIALQKAIAEPVKKGEDSVYYLSRKVMKTLADPLEIYMRIIALPGKPLPLNTRLNLLVGLQLLAPNEAHSYVVLSGIFAADRNRLKKHVSWRDACLVRMSRDAYVIAEEWKESVMTAIKKMRVKALVHTVTMRPIPLR